MVHCKKMRIYVVFEKGPDRTSMVACESLEMAEGLVKAGEEYWKELIEVNLVPKREYTIRTFEEV